MKRLYEVLIGEHEGQYVALVFSATENKRVQVQDENLRVVMAKIAKLVRKRQKLIRNFPIPEADKMLVKAWNGDEVVQPPVVLAASN